MSDTRPPVPRQRPLRRRALTWLAWWVLLMGLWTAVDDSVQFDELLAGAGAAALAALGVEVAAYQASVRIRVGRHGRFIGEAARLPARVLEDTAAVFAALVRREAPRGEYAEVPVDVPADETGQVLLAGARSFTPNSFVVSLSPESGTMLVHRLVAPREPQSGGEP